MAQVSTTNCQPAATSSQKTLVFEALACKLKEIEGRFAASASADPQVEGYNLAQPSGGATQPCSPPSQVAVSTSLGTAGAGSSSDAIEKAPLLEPQPASAAQAKPSARVAVAQPALMADSQQGENQRMGARQKEASGGQMAASAHPQQAGSQPTGPSGLAMQDTAGISGIW